MRAPTPVAYEDMDPHSKRLMDACDWRGMEITEGHIAAPNRPNFANIAYIDDKIGEILALLEATRQEAHIVFLSDHGEMLGEKGLWFKMNFFEGSARVPLMIAAPEIACGPDRNPVSSIDLAPTLAALAGISMNEVAPWTEGVNLIPVANGAPRGPVAMEYAAEGTITPMVALREGAWKNIRCPADPEQLFDVANDPGETTNLAQDPRAAEVLQHFRKLADQRWDLAAYDAQSAKARPAAGWCMKHCGTAPIFPWDHQPLRAASERYMRNHMDLNVLEESKRFPRGE